MKRISVHTNRAATLVFALVTLASAVLAAEDNATRIELKNVPLVDAVKNLARHSELNYILDPHLPGSGFGPGRLVRSPSINVLWTNITPRAALRALLEEHQLTMVTSPATTITRIAHADQKVKPVAATQVGTNSSNIIPVVTMESMPLTQAITTMARAAKLTVSFDPKVAAPAIDPQGTVSVRWERVTARQALAALLDNYDLNMTEDPESATARITLKTKIAEPEQR